MLTTIHWIPFWTLFCREVHRFMRVLGQTILSPIISSILYLLVFGISLGQHLPVFKGEINYLNFLIPGIIMMSVINNAFQNGAGSIAISKFHGNLEELKMAPISPSQIVWGMGFACMVRGMLVACTAYLVALVIDYLNADISILTIESLLAALFFLVIGGLSFGFLGIVIGFWARNFDMLNAFAAFVLLPLIYLGGVFFSLEYLHPFWQKLSSFNPVLYFINGLRYSMLGVSDLDVGVCALISTAFLLFFYCLARLAVATGSYRRW